MSLQTHPNPALQRGRRAVRATRRRRAGNRDFEVAATLFHVTGKTRSARPGDQRGRALYDDFAARTAVSGGERDAINCVQLYRVTRDKQHLDLAKHYLDIRGLENSVDRSRHNQWSSRCSSSASRRSRRELRDADGALADVGVLTGLKAYLGAAQQMWADALRRCTSPAASARPATRALAGPLAANMSAYAETCAVLMLITLNHRLFLATGDSKYIDVMERGMYNNALSGVSHVWRSVFLRQSSGERRRRTR